MVRLKLNGKPLDLSAPTGAEIRLKAFLDKAPADELWNFDDLAGKVRLSPSHLRQVMKRPAFESYSVRAGKVRYYGNPKAIAELLKQVAQ